VDVVSVELIACSRKTVEPVPSNGTGSIVILPIVILSME
jgi:hypothetical protein